MPLALGHALANQGAVGVRRQRLLPPMPALVAEPTRGGQVRAPIAAPILAGNQVFRGASKGGGCSSAQAQAGKLLRRGAPHGQLAVEAAATLGFKGGITGIDTRLGHRGSIGRDRGLFSRWLFNSPIGHLAPYGHMQAGTLAIYRPT